MVSASTARRNPGDAAVEAIGKVKGNDPTARFS
jgi:hypothetical protein